MLYKSVLLIGGWEMGGIGKMWISLESWRHALVARVKMMSMGTI